MWTFSCEEDQLPKIVETIGIGAPKDRVWEIVADIDNEPIYWRGTKLVKNISRNGNVTDREIYQNFGNHRITQKVIMKPKNEIEIRYVHGIIEGAKFLRLDSNGEDSEKVIVEWDIQFKGLYRLLSPWISGHIRKGTKDALQRIKDASEGRSITTLEDVSKKPGVN